MEGEENEKSDYPTSVNAIMQRRNSMRRHSRRKRRGSSPFNPDMENSVRRRSSAGTTTSEDGGEEYIFEKLKLHKEVLSGVKQQPWPLRKKIQLVKQAKAYVRQHEGVLQERLAQNRSTRNVLARASLLINKKWQYLKRELINFQTWFVPWESRIKEIESHFGSAVASYFTFLRWLFWINLVISLALTVFVAVPEVFTADVILAGERKIMLPEEKKVSKNLRTLWEFQGVLKYSPFFYGWYTNQDTNRGYKLPLAYFLTNLAVYTYSFVAILRKMAENSRMSKLSEKEDECVFSWKLFIAWDFMIGNPETAHNRTASIVLGFKEALLEEAEKEKDQKRWKIIVMRVFVNIIVLLLFMISAYAVVTTVGRSNETKAGDSWWRINETSTVTSLINGIFPIFFEILGIFENYHPRKQLRFQLTRVMILNLLNLYSLIVAQFHEISVMKVQLQSLRPRPQKPAPTTCIMCVPCKTTDIANALTALASFCLVFMPHFAANSSQKITQIPQFQTSSTTPVTTINYYNETTYENTETSHLDQLTPFPTKIYTPNNTYTNDSDYDYDNETPNSDYDYAEGKNITNQTNTTSSTVYDYDDKASESDYDYCEKNVTNDTTTTRSAVEISDYNDDDPHINYDYYGYSNYTDKTTTSDPTTTENSFTTDTENTSKVESTIIPSIEENIMKQCLVFNATKDCYECHERICEHDEAFPENTQERMNKSSGKLNMTTRRELRKLCWETMFGQELAKLTLMDLLITVASILGVDFFRALFVRYMNVHWCWDLEKRFPQYGDFKIAENILQLVNNQGMVWMGMFFSPGLSTLNIVKLGILMHMRSWAVMTCNVPHEVVFRASRSNNFYFALLLLMLFLCVLPVGYAIVWVEPSWHCGPFSDYKRIYQLATKSLKSALPESTHRILDYIASPGIVIPLIVLMALIIYYLVSLAGSLREANDDLKIQLRQERIEERRKMLKIAEKRRENNETPSMKWKKVFPNLQTGSARGQDFSDIVKTIMAMKKEEKEKQMDTDVAEIVDEERKNEILNYSIQKEEFKSEQSNEYNMMSETKIYTISNNVSFAPDKPNS